MNSHGQVRKVLPWLGVLWRYLLVCLLVFATYNPSYYTLTAWILTSGDPISARVLAAFVLGVAWFIVLRFSLQGLGNFGGFLVALALLIIALLEQKYRVLAALDGFMLTVALLMIFSAVVTTGLTLSYWIRQATGQSPVVKHPP